MSGFHDPEKVPAPALEGAMRKITERRSVL